MPITEGGRFTPNNRIVSPGVFSRENDISGIAQGVADIGAVVVSPFAKGPGFSPTTVLSVADLESQFGVADGTFYGPYTAKQYLQEKGFVTVCRVGALTGYQQKYPWVIWAENGVWLRNADAGWINETSSFVNITGTTWTATPNVPSNTVAFGTGSFVRGTASINNQQVTIVLRSSASTAVQTTLNNFGSTLYNGATVTGFISGNFTFSGSVNVSLASATSASVLNALFVQELFSGSLAQFSFTSSQSPFDTATVYTASVIASVDSCNNPSLEFYGFLTGSIGAYSGNFLSGSGVFNPCNGTWTMSGTSFKVLAVLADTQNAEINSQLQAPGFLGSTQSYNPLPTGTNTVGLEFELELSQSTDGGYGIYDFSLDPNSQKYISNVFGKNPQAGDPATHAEGTKIEAAYLYNLFDNDIAAVASDPTSWRINGTAMPSGSWTGEPLNFTDAFSLNLRNGDSQFGLTNAFTPWVVSQEISPFNGGTPHRFPLFRLLTLADGTYTNTAYKIEISNVKLAGTVAGSDWGTFTLTVRDYSDTDKRVKILEQFNNLNLDPTSANFIARRIGDRYNFIRFDGKIIEFGTYENLSKKIRVEMTDLPYPTTAVPYGFQAYSTTFNGAMGFHCDPVAYSKASVYGLFPGKYPSGVVFDDAPSGADAELAGLYPTSSLGNGVADDNKQYFGPVPAGAGVGNNTLFALDEEITDEGVGTGSFIANSNAVPAIFDAANETTYVKMRKFVFGFQGGFDGQSPAIPINLGGNMTQGNTQGLNCTNPNSAGSVAYNQAIGALGNADEFDINLIVTPGIVYSLHSFVTNLVVEMCETRGDCFYILDLYEDDGNPTSGQIDTVVGLAGEFDTNYAAAYYPWVKIKDTNINQIVTVPPSVVMAGVYAANDRVAAEWFAAAGLNRGGITQAIQVTDRTTHVERDTLYEGRVNPIAAFPGQGIVAWGQKTLQVADTALNRINVRRLLIEIKKFFASTGRFLVFEQNTAATRNKFLSVVNPYLESVQQRSGLFAFQVVMDDSNNTADLIDQNILYGQIFLKPTKTAEFIIFDFNITTTGAIFPNA